MTPDAFVELLKGGEWSSSEYVFLHPNPDTISYDHDSRLLILHSFSVTDPVITERSVGRLVLQRPDVRKENKPKSEGGGFREVPFLRVVAHFFHKTHVEKKILEAQENARRREEEQRRLALEKEDRERRAAEQKIADEAEADRRRVAFVEQLNKRLAGRKITHVTLQSPLRLVFEMETGDQVVVDSYDTCGEWEESRLVIDGIDMTTVTEEVKMY